MRTSERTFTQWASSALESHRRLGPLVDGEGEDVRARVVAGRIEVVREAGAVRDVDVRHEDLLAVVRGACQHRPVGAHDDAAAADEVATDPGEIALQERVGYYGERVALRAVQLGLETSWAVLDDADTAEHPWWCLHPGEKIVWMRAFGHGARPGGRRRSKPIEELCRIPDGMAMPDWFRAGMEAAMLAPTSLSQQPFLFTLYEDGTVSAEATEGLFAHVGLGCAKYHFEVGAGRENVRWRDTAASGEEAAGATD